LGRNIYEEYSMREQGIRDKPRGRQLNVFSGLSLDARVQNEGTATAVVERPAARHVTPRAKRPPPSGPFCRL